MNKSKEEIYDDQVAPLMAQIIAICQENRIALLASFELDKTIDDEPLFCTTALLGEKYGSSSKLNAAANTILKNPTSIFFLQ